MDFEEVYQILVALEQAQVRYVLVGSMAMAAQGLIRATRDMDIFVSPDAANVERLRSALRQVFGGDAHIEEISADDLQGAYPAIEYAPPHGLYSIDILSRLGEAFSFDDIEWQRHRVGDVDICVATPQMLYRMKKDTVRPQDKVDAAALRQRFKLEDS